MGCDDSDFPIPRSSGPRLGTFRSGRARFLAPQPRVGGPSYVGVPRKVLRTSLPIIPQFVCFSCSPIARIRMLFLPFRNYLTRVAQSDSPCTYPSLSDSLPPLSGLPRRPSTPSNPSGPPPLTHLDLSASPPLPFRTVRVSKRVESHRGAPSTVRLLSCVMERGSRGDRSQESVGRSISAGKHG